MFALGENDHATKNAKLLISREYEETKLHERAIEIL